MKRLAFVLLLAGLAASVLLVTPRPAAQASPPADSIALLAIDADLTGTTISAIASDGLTWATTTTSGGSYQMDVPATMPVTPPCFPGGMISFQCDGVWAAETGEATGDLENLNLTCGPPD